MSKNNKNNLVPKGYVKVLDNHNGKFLCVPKSDAEKKNWKTKKAVIVDETFNKVSKKMPMQATFKWVRWYDIPGMEY